MIKAVIFDLYGTILTSEEGPESRDEVLSRLLRESGCDVYFQELWAARQLVAFVDYPRGRADTPHQYYSKVLERLELPHNTGLIEKLVLEDSRLERPVLYPEVASTVDALRAKRVKTAILTTIASWKFVPLLQRKNVKIDFVCTAREAEAVKPNPRIYETVMNRFRVSANETLMVGDDVKTDIEPAKELGMKTALLCRKARAECPAADHIVTSLLELPSLLKEQDDA